MRSTTSGERATGEVLGRRERGSRAVSPFGFVAGLELVDPGAVDAVAGGDLGRGLVVDEQGGDDQAGFRRGSQHGRGSGPAGLSPMTRRAFDVGRSMAEDPARPACRR
ncbi:MAG TPA: hypothetical protein VFD59_15470 [Nocardioidaceae bacterium]|nr:hypothetical protein [Nocardioidaceae bacterium]